MCMHAENHVLINFYKIRNRILKKNFLNLRRNNLNDKKEKNFKKQNFF